MGNGEFNHVNPIKDIGRGIFPPRVFGDDQGDFIGAKVLLTSLEHRQVAIVNRIKRGTV
jgi:hypothetical protein